MDEYEINSNTIALIPIDSEKTKVIEEKETFMVEMCAMKIIERSCEFFGSTYLGRHMGTKALTGISHKSPIIIEESKNIIYFPTTSPRLDECMWLSLKHIQNYKDENGKLMVFFENGQNINVDISYGSFDNQYLRATKLESILRKRKLS
ncbi:MAG: competence protein ComK [Bacilli bacterium]|nr:competence protein ComK [Bacilli bacterium]